MIFFGRALISIANVLGLVLDGFKLLILAAVILSWVRPDPHNPFVRVVYQLTEPVFRWVRQRLPKQLFATGMDFTPLIILLGLVFLDSFLVGGLIDYGRNAIYSAQIESRFQNLELRPLDSEGKSDAELFKIE